MKNNDLEDYIINLAELVGFDLEAGTWSNEPTQLQQSVPGLPIALSRLFLALRCANPQDSGR
ncbi:hypothetical protein [Rhabdochromatium marinum]|uniref:hypothetical protein n=1 Tax=Rhabdochromatium marinum TaxID=48729 RepID=UPI001904643A|nr:hypothetical protein [Rhabdochromatium marinum]MBK1648776.1 hypothetical protein [Rhabdochromatium marinum]